MCKKQLCDQCGHIEACLVGSGRPQVHLQEQVLMLLHFVAHRGKYGLLADKFGFTRSCYFSCIEEMIGIVCDNLL